MLWNLVRAGGRVEHLPHQQAIILIEISQIHRCSFLHSRLVSGAHSLWCFASPTPSPQPPCLPLEHGLISGLEQTPTHSLPPTLSSLLPVCAHDCSIAQKKLSGVGF